MEKLNTEVKRIINVYEGRKSTVPSQRYSFFNSANYYSVQIRDWEILNALKKHGIKSLKEKKILDIGCGKGDELINLIRYGAQPENLYGVELLPDRIEEAKKLNPFIDFRCCDASKLPFPDQEFDIIMQFTVFTSILSAEMKNRIANEMQRVLKPDGLIIWYDYHMNNPFNLNVRGVKKQEIYDLFRNCQILLKRITLAPPLVRTLVSFSWLFCYFLERLVIFNTHYIGIIKKKRDHD